LIFILQWFTWVSIAPGGVDAVTQNAWQAAFGGYTEDPNMKEALRQVLPNTPFLFHGIITEEEASKLKGDKKDKDKEKDKDKKAEPEVIPNRPGISPLLLFYLFPFFVLALAVALFVAVVPYRGNVKLPAQVQQLMPWKWSILAGLNVILLLFLTLQLFLSFSLENNVMAAIEAADPDVAQVRKDPANMRVEPRMRAEVKLGLAKQQLRRSSALTVAFVLHLLATLAALLLYWRERRGSGRPDPVLELRH